METALTRRLLTIPQTHDSFGGVPTVLSAIEEKILYAVYRLPYLRIEQICQYVGRSATSNWTDKLVTRLLAREYLAVQPLPRLTPSGKLPHLYILGTQGIRFFQKQDFPVSYHSPKERLRSFGHITHAIRVSAVLLAAHQLSRLEPAITLTAFQHDLRIKLTPCKVLVEEKPVALNPDGALDWYLIPPYGAPGADRFSCFLEVDNDEEDKSQLTPKVAKYVSFCERRIAYTPFGFDLVQAIVFVITQGGMRRVKQVRTWIKQELERLGKATVAPVFKVAHVPLPPLSLDPSFFTAPLFYPLLTERPSALLEKL
jgi:protein involved in plasmid replication-relaxation